jgi:hypothetical protein
MTDNTTNIIASIFNIENGNNVLNPDLENDVIVIDSSNIRLGIGTADPSYSLDVSGNAKINNLTLDNTNLTFGNNSHNDSSIYSLAFGDNTYNIVNSKYSLAFGNKYVYNQSSSNSLAFGDNNTYNNNSRNCFAFGNNHVYNNSSNYSFAFGNNYIHNNGSIYSLAFGNTNVYNSNNSYNSLAFGNTNVYNSNISHNSLAFGHSVNNSNSPYSIAFGNNVNNSSVSYSYLFGQSLTGQHSNCLVIGKYNSIPSTSMAFIVGGGNSTTPSNILTLDYNGNLSIDGVHSPFTGAHGNNNNLDKLINNLHNGLIVSTNNSYINIDFSIYPTIDESLPYCNLTTKENDKSVFGVVNAKNQNSLRINSLGEGAMWVCNINGNLENGDYITSSKIPGYGQKQTLNEGILCNFTVAKITANCEFNLTKNVKKKVKTLSGSNGEDILEYDENNQIQYIDDLDENGNQQLVYKYNTRFIDLEGNILKDSEGNNLELTQEELDLRISNGEETYIACFIGCTYHCG